jgi:pilus assembly protein CpaC
MHRQRFHSYWAVSLITIGLIGGGTATLLRAGDEPAPLPHTESTAPKASNLIVPIGSSQRLQMKDKKVIRSVVNPKDNIAIVQALPDDSTTVLITGREAGTTRITLTAADGTVENYEVLVQFDVEYLRSLLARAVPTASIQLIPAASGVIIISGTVAHAEDVDIIMRTAQSVVANPDRIINAMRVGGVQQVQLDVIVAFVSRSEFRRMSFDFLDIGQHHNLSSTVGGALINPQLGTSLPSTTGVNLPIGNIITAPNGAPANFFLGVFNNEQAFFGLLQALRNENLIKILAEPKLMTQSGRSANLLSGGQQAIPETAGLGSISVRFEPFGTQLTFLPIVLGNGKIHLEVEPEVSNIDPTVGTTIAGTVVPGRSTQRVHTTVELEDGQTLALGGLIQNTVTGTTQKVPILGDLPFIGAAFSSKSYQENESELVVMVTPHLVDGQSCDQVVKMVPGQETRSPDDFELFLEGILEAPRGQREVFLDGRYEPAYKNGPTADIYPCGPVGCGGNGCGRSCSSGGCNVSDPHAWSSPRSAVSNDVTHSAVEVVPSTHFGTRDGRPYELPATVGSTISER